MQPLGMHNNILGAGETKHISNYNPEEETTHQQRSKYSLIGIVSIGYAKTRRSYNHAAVNQDRFHQRAGCAP